MVFLYFSFLFSFSFSFIYPFWNYSHLFPAAMGISFYFFLECFFVYEFTAIHSLQMNKIAKLLQNYFLLPSSEIAKSFLFLTMRAFSKRYLGRFSTLLCHPHFLSSQFLSSGKTISFGRKKRGLFCHYS